MELVEQDFVLSVDDMLKYIVLPGFKQRKIDEKREPSRLEVVSKKLDRFEPIKDKKKRRFSIDDILKEVKSEKKEVKGVVRYETFIAAENVFDSVKVKYNSKGDSESVELSLKKGKDTSSIALERPADGPEYSVEIAYNSAKKGYDIKYASYFDKLKDSRQDFTNRVDKVLSMLPKSLMGGVLGFTYLGSGHMTRRDDLTGGMARMVDVHEAIHTPDEYETRVLTDWMITKEAPKYKH